MRKTYMTIRRQLRALLLLIATTPFFPTISRTVATNITGCNIKTNDSIADSSNPPSAH